MPPTTPTGALCLNVVIEPAIEFGMVETPPAAVCEA